MADHPRLPYPFPAIFQKYTMSALIELTLMRHARSRADDENVHEGRYDSPLTDAGRKQVSKRAEYFIAEGYKPEKIIASSLIRARETAEIVAQALGADFETDPDWMEFNNGPLAGLSYAEASARYPQPDFRNPYEPYHGSGESEIEFHSRVGRALERVIRRGAGKYLIIGHGGSLNAALRVALGIPYPVNQAGVWFKFGDTGFARLSYYPERHRWVINELVAE
jgi:2,3-bisphosphoglycerate-dependent phosphoglycerate mutase